MARPRVSTERLSSAHHEPLVKDTFKLDEPRRFKTIWRLPDVLACTGISRSAIYEKMRTGDFPRSVKLGARAVGWIAEEVERWIQERIDASRTDDQ